jgi:hypothetical protein
MKNILFLLILFTSCTNGEKKRDSTGEVIPVTDTSKTMALQPDTGIYSIQLTSTVSLSLQQWDSTINLNEHLGAPLKQSTKQLDERSDTHAGSFIKKLEWAGLKLQLFSPDQNGKAFWIQEIIVTGNQYKTSRGIVIGDTYEKVHNAYPALKKFPGDSKNMYYLADEGYEKSIEIEFENNRLKQWRLYYTLQ